jgi:hypothetical protein
MTRHGPRPHHAAAISQRAPNTSVPTGAPTLFDMIFSARCSDFQERWPLDCALRSTPNASDTDPRRYPNRHGRPAKHGESPKSP